MGYEPSDSRPPWRFCLAAVAPSLDREANWRAQLLKNATQKGPPGTATAYGSPSLSPYFIVGSFVRVAPTRSDCRANEEARDSPSVGSRAARSGIKAEACEQSARRIDAVPREASLLRRETSGHPGIAHRSRTGSRRHGSQRETPPGCKFMNSRGSKAFALFG